MNPFVLATFTLLVVAVLLAACVEFWRRKYQEASAEIQRLQSALDAKVVRLDHAPEAGSYTAVVYPSHFGED